MTSLYDISVQTIDGQTQTLDAYRNQVLLIVNVASECGFTPQYQGLESLYQKYKNKGFVVLGFPCNQFGGQEPGSDSEIQTFCTRKFGVTFPLFSKIDVNGPETHPLYQHLKKEGKGIFGTEAIKWNFTKFLVDSKGQVIERFSSQTQPNALELEIEKLL
jgi:glutathione peroxidase